VTAVTLDLVGAERGILDHGETGLDPPLIPTGQGGDVLEAEFPEGFAGQN
jgi:hypothetical protein